MSTLKQDETIEEETFCDCCGKSIEYDEDEEEFFPTCDQCLSALVKSSLY